MMILFDQGCKCQINILIRCKDVIWYQGSAFNENSPWRQGTVFIKYEILFLAKACMFASLNPITGTSKSENFSLVRFVKYITSLFDLQ